MARYIADNRDAGLFVTGSLETLLPQNAVARTLRAALDKLDFSGFDARYRNDEAGRRALDPRSLTAVWILALLRGVTSSVRLAVLCGEELEFRWLLGDAKVEKSTLCDFRKTHWAEISALGSQVLVALGRGGLLPGKSLGVDGTIVRAASSRHAVKTRHGLEKQLTQVETLLRERLCEDREGLVQEQEVLEGHRRKMVEALAQMEAMGLTKDKDRLTVTEPSAKLLRQKNGSYAPSYTIQAVPDLDSGAIIHAEVVDAGNDCGQLRPQLEQARAVLEQVGAVGPADAAPSVVADGAYHDTRQLAHLEEQGVACYVPEDRNANRQNPNASPEYQAEAFTYDGQTDTFRCPQGQMLAYRKPNNTNTSAIYQANASCCAACPAKEHCCPKTKEGRSVSRSLYTEVLDTVAQRVASEQGGQMKRARWIACEGVFARLNGLLHWTRCRLWDWEGVRAELAWRQFVHNLMLLTGLWKPLVPQWNTA